MELIEINGDLVWIKADGKVSKKPVNDKERLKYYGFEFPWSDSGTVVILKGDPKKCEIVLLDVSAGKYFGKYLLRKMSGGGMFDYAYLRKEAIKFAENLVNNPPDADMSLGEIIEKHREEQRDKVDIYALSGISGLKVWQSVYFAGYWCREAGEFNGLPDGWAILPKGDSLFTRRVRRGPHWVLLKKQKGYTVEIGTAAPECTIERVFSDLGGEEAQRKRLADKLKSTEQREKTMTEKFRSAISRLYPGIPQQDVDETIEYARRRGAVGSAQWLYFHIAGQGEEAFNCAAALAVRAHVRHKFTRYDQILAEPPEGEEEAFYSGDEHRKAARVEVFGHIEDVLGKWR